MKIKILGFLYVLVIIIELINGQDDIKVDQQSSNNQDQRAPEKLKSVSGDSRRGLSPSPLELQMQQGSPGSPGLPESLGSLIGQEQMKYTLIPAQTDSPYTTSFMAEWPYGVVPYYIDGDTYDDTIQRRIQKAMSIVESSSCVIFRQETVKPQGSNVSWLHFTNPNHQRECSHDTTQGDDGDIIIVLGIECLKSRDVLHSLLHGLGFKDEVSHPHRDQYIRILWENIQPRYRPLFRVRLDKAPYKLVEYDPMSIMHFHDRAYSENGGLTIAPVMPGLTIDPSDKLSQLDVMKLRIMFGQECNKRKVGDLIENCKNVLYNQSPHSEDEQQNAEESEDVKLVNKGKENDEKLNEEDDDEQSSEEDNKQLNAEGETDDNKQFNAEGETDDDKQLNAERETDDNKQLNAEGETDDETQSTAEEKDGDQQLNAKEKDDGKPLNEGEEVSNQQLNLEEHDSQQLNAKDEHVKQQLYARIDPEVEYLPLHGKEYLRRDSPNPEKAKDEIADGVKEGRRDNPLHLWKYNTDKLH